MVIRKVEIEKSLQEEQQLIQGGAIKEDNPLDLSDDFSKLCESCRRGDLKGCQEALTAGANLNARDRFDYTPLILVRMPPAMNGSDLQTEVRCRQASVVIMRSSNYY